MTEVAGPYWINHSGRDEVHVCGRHGKIIARFSLLREAEAHALVDRLQAGIPFFIQRPVGARPTKAQADVLRRAREGIEFRAPALSGVFVECAKLGWIAADLTDYGLHVTLTAAGMEVAP